MPKESKTCEGCKQTFFRQTTGSKRTSPSVFESRRFCSDKCRANTLKLFGSASYNWRGGKTRCSTCSKELTTRYTKRDKVNCKKCWSKTRKGSNHPNWKGGITPLRTAIWKSEQYQNWRSAVFARDSYTCQHCGDNQGGNLEADHILPFAYFPEKRFDIENGRTLCKDCHKKTDTYGTKATTFYLNYAIQ